MCYIIHDCIIVKSRLFHSNEQINSTLLYRKIPVIIKNSNNYLL